ncbi:MAG: hypothetical protein ACE5EX_10825 [Phycisphaerae bacterium]
MRITSIDFAGAVEKGDKLPRAFARVSRKLDSDQIEVTLLSHDGERTHRVQADCEEDLWSMAERLQRHLDGVRGTNSMIHDYYRELRRLTD